MLMSIIGGFFKNPVTAFTIAIVVSASVMNF